MKIVENKKNDHAWKCDFLSQLIAVNYDAKCFNCNKLYIFFKNSIIVHFKLEYILIIMSANLNKMSVKLKVRR